MPHPVIRLCLPFLLVAAACRQPPARVLASDDLGRRVALPPYARRIVTLAPNLTEIAGALGVVSRLVGTDDASNEPPSVRSLPKVGGVQPNAEKIAALAPDLILASSSVSPAVLLRALQPLRIPLFVARTDRLSDIGRTLRNVGRVLGVEQSEAVARTFERSLAAQKRRRAEPPRVLFLVWTRPLYVAGRQTFVDDLIALTGAENAVPEQVTGWPQYSMEQLLAAPPDIILYPSRSLPRQDLEAFFRSDKRWLEIGAVREGRCFGIDEDRYTRAAPRVAEAAADLNALLDGWERKR